MDTEALTLVLEGKEAMFPHANPIAPTEGRGDLSRFTHYRAELPKCLVLPAQSRAICQDPTGLPWREQLLAGGEAAAGGQRSTPAPG